MTNKAWRVSEQPGEDQARQLAERLNIPRALASLLLQRGFDNEAEARRFLRPGLEDLHDPYLLKDMDRTVDAIERVVRGGGRIMVHGDYDVDGQCATALLTRTLRLAGAEVVPFVPHRLRDGYDFGPAGLTKAVDERVQLIVTCDCGITATETARQTREAGIELVVTDHHLPGELPDALAVINPRRPDCDYPSPDLCGTGVIFKLAQALVPRLGLPANFDKHLLDLAALATVADIVALRGENRVIVRHGLRLLPGSSWPGLRALVSAAGLSGPITAGQVGYILGPRLNAAGRVGDAMLGVELLLTDDEQEAARIAARLESMNEERQEIDRVTLEQAAEILAAEDPEQLRGIVLASEGWHPGVIGIVASRVVERFYRPTILIAVNDGIGKGSGRSIPGFDLHAALDACGDSLIKYGGHTMAAGLTIDEAKIPEFTRRFDQYCRETLEPEQLIPRQRIDLVVDFDEIDDNLERLLNHFEPCGAGNPRPVLGVRDARAVNWRVLSERHLKMVVENNGRRLEAIGFDFAARVPEDTLAGKFDLAFTLDRNEWRGRSTLQAKIVDVQCH